MGPAGPAAGHGKLKSLTDTEIRSITTIINYLNLVIIAKVKHLDLRDSFVENVGIIDKKIQEKDEYQIKEISINEVVVVDGLY